MLTTSQSTGNETSRNTGATKRRIMDELLERCRHATTAEQHESSWGALVDHVVVVTTSTRMDGSESERSVVASTVRQVLVEWPYNSVYSIHMDRFLDASGTTVSVSACCSLLRELGATSSSSSAKGDPEKISSKLPRPSMLQACWATLQRHLLSKNKDNHQKDDDDKDQQQQSSYPPTFAVVPTDLERLVKLILSIPTLMANACHVCGVRLPLLATSTKFYPRLIDCSWNYESSSSYRIALLKGFLTSRNNAEPVAIGLATHHPLPTLSSSSSSSSSSATSWTSREMNNLILALLQHCVATHSSHSTDTGSSNDTEFTEKVLTTCQMLVMSASTEQQEAVVHHIVLKMITADVRLCPLFISLLDRCDILLPSLCDVAEAWSQWSFCQSVPTQYQRYVSQMILEGLNRCAPLIEPGGGEDPLTLNLLQGVTHRLESFLPELRLDGMRVARQVARRMNQELQFVELDEAEKADATSDIPTTKEDDGKKKEHIAINDDLETLKVVKQSSKKKSKKLSDPDADYDSDDDEDDDDDDGPDGRQIKGDASATEDDDSSTMYDDELVPYSLEDEEEDLVETTKPLHLLQALELLRTGESDEHAYSHHETAIRALPELIRKRPDDLPDVAISLLLQVLRMENKFGMEEFLQLRQQSLVALTVEQPIEIGQQLIEEIYKDGTLSDRLACFGALQEAAYELSGSKELDQHTISRGRKETFIGEESIKGIPKDSEESTTDPSTVIQAQVTRLNAKTRRKRSPRLVPVIIKNTFMHVAPTWFYSLMGQFLKERDNETLWSGSTGSQLLASLFRTLAVIVEFAGVPSAPVLAKDLMELVWSFVDADVAEVRMAVLISVATSIAMLPEDRVLSILLEHGESFPLAIGSMSRTDPDNNCRQLATTISQSIANVLRDIQSTLL